MYKIIPIQLPAANPSINITQFYLSAVIYTAKHKEINTGIKNTINYNAVLILLISGFNRKIGIYSKKLYVARPKIIMLV